jgi:putative RecB family exonuclease
MGNVKGDFAVEDPDQANVYATEFQAEATIDGLPILGFIDRIDVLDDATMRITDYKCGADRSKKPAPGFSDDHGDQIREYKVLLEHVLAERGELNPNGEPWRVSIGRDIYVTHGKQRRVSISKKSDIKRAMSKLRSGWDGLKQSVGTAMFECRVTPLCGWCPAVNSCPLAQAAGKVDRLGTALSADILAIPSLQMASTHTESDADHKVCPVVDGRRDAPCPTTTVAAEAPEETRDNDTTSKETTMSNLRSQTAPWREAKPWEGEFIDGHINMNGQCIQAAGVYTSTAINMLLENNLSTGPRSIKTLRDTLEMLTRRVQRQVTEGDDPSKGAAIRARFSVFSAIKVHPAPFGVTEPDLWSAWAEEVAKTAETLLRSDIASVEGRLPYEAQPWRELVHVKPRNPWNDPRPAATD